MKLKDSMKNLSRLFVIALVVVGLLVAFTSSVLALFTNGNFETGDLTGWTLTNFKNTGLSGSPPFNGTNIVRDSPGTMYNLTNVLGPFATMSQTDANTGNALHYPYSGQYCALINYQSSNVYGHGRNANSLMQQSVTTSADVQPDGNIHIQFAWAAVVENPGHADNQQPYIYVAMTNVTKSTLLYEQFMFANNTDPRWHPGTGDAQYTDWQIMNQGFTPAELTVGDTVKIECTAAGCSLGGHWGYLYVDCFGSVSPNAPTVTSINPARGNQGQCPETVVISGTNFTGATAVSFGSGIAINSFTVNSATKITAVICISPGAALGTRNVTVTTPSGTGTKTAGFTVLLSLDDDSAGSSSTGPTTYAYNPPVALSNITVQSASLSAKAVTPGTPVTVTADITNKSAVNGNKRVTLYVNGQVDNSQGLSLSSGGSTRLTFNVSRNEPGNYTVYVDGVPAGSFVVDQFAGGNIIAYISIALILFALIIGIFYFARRRRASV